MSQLKESEPERLRIPFKDIEIATNNFQTCIGKGGYGRVYKGELYISEKRTTVAVKRLYEQCGQGSKEFLTEIALLSGQKHPNLISLLGYCEEGNEKIIIYEYAERGSLDQYLRHGNTTFTLTWLERLKVCVDIARGLDHLHNRVGKHQTIIHRDIKSANVLVDCNWVAKISDLGLSKLSLAGLNRSAVISHACGTPGYCEPEYITSGIVTKESDVYSFGMVLVEILCGRLCTIRDAEGLFLLDYYKMNKLVEIIDPSLRNQMTCTSINKFLAIVNGCLHKVRGRRYPIYHVVKELDELLQTELSLTNEAGMVSKLILRDKFQGLSSNFSFNNLVKRRTNVAKIFEIFDLNTDGGLSRKEVAAFLLVTKSNIKHGEEQISTCDEVLSLYENHVDDEKGLTYHGLLQYYADGHGDLDSDIKRLVSDESYSNDDGSSRFERLKRLIQKFDGGLTYNRLLKLDLDIDGHGLHGISTTNNEGDSALLFGSPESLVIVRPSRYRPMLLRWAITPFFMLFLAMVLIKLSFIWFLFLVFSHFINACKNKLRKSVG